MNYFEAARLRALQSYAVLDTEPEPDFDRITRLAASIFEFPVCTLSLADTDRHWFKSHYGVDATEIPRRMSFCNETIRTTGGFVVPDALQDVRFAAAPIVSGPPGFRFYAGFPLITRHGQPIGSLCVLDTRPYDGFTRDKMRILADLAGTSMELLEARARNLQLAQSTEELTHLAGHDPLTGLGNRRMLQKYVDAAAAHRDSGVELALLYLDLDRFKLVNDTMGHGCGDDLLQQVARRLCESVREGDQVTRLGGDEFAVLLGGRNVRSTAPELASRLIEMISAPYMVHGRMARVGVSIGLTFVPVIAGHVAPVDEVLRNADVALYAAKAGGRGRYSCFEPVSMAAECSGSGMRDGAIFAAGTHRSQEPLCDSVGVP